MPHVLGLILTIALDPVLPDPSVSDFAFLPSREVAAWGAAAAYGEVGRLETQLAWCGFYKNDNPPPLRVQLLEQQLVEARAAYRNWDALADAYMAKAYWEECRNAEWFQCFARGAWGTEESVREHLGILRQRIGPALYYSGMMPSPVNLSHYREIP